MLEPWILSKLDPQKTVPVIVLRDPQRMIRPGARAVDGWAVEHGYTVLFCTGNLALREMYERLRGGSGVKILLVDRSRGDNSLFYPDLQAAAPRPPLDLNLRDYLCDVTGDSAWPNLVTDRNLSRLILANLDGVLAAHASLREVSPDRFSDSDLYKIVLGGALRINPFRRLSPPEVRRLCIEQHERLDEVKKLLPDEVMAILRQAISAAPRPFNLLLDNDPETILRAFTLSGLLRQHGLEYALLLPNLDPRLFEYRSMDARMLDEAMQDFTASDPDPVIADIQKAEDFLKEVPSRLAFLLREQLRLDDPAQALQALERERLSNLVRSMALASLLVDLILNKQWKEHAEYLKKIELFEKDAGAPVRRRPTEQWNQLLSAYRRAIGLFQLIARLRELVREVRVALPGEATFAWFDKVWNQEHLNRLDFYISDLQRMLRIGDMLPLAHAQLWDTFESRWSAAGAAFNEAVTSVQQGMEILNARFQDLYAQHYTTWITQSDAPAVFTHQFLSRIFKAHWDPQSGRKAYILVFDGLRTDAWDEFVRPVLEERFDLLQTRPGSAILPTETELSRKAIAAGKMPLDFQVGSKREVNLLSAWLQANMGLAPQFEVLKDENVAASGMTVRYTSPQMEYVVFNFTDENLHHNAQDLSFIYQHTVREIVRQDVRSVLREIPSDAMIFVTSDHGFTAMPADSIEIGEEVVGDLELVKYRAARVARPLAGVDAAKTVTFNIRDLKIPVPDLRRGQEPIQHVLFPRPPYIFHRASDRRQSDRYSHGGLSMAECLIPMAVLGPRKAGRGVVTIDDLVQVGSMSEGDPLEFEVRLLSNEILYEGMPVTLTFSQPGLAERKEFFSGATKTFRIQWKRPRLEITPEDNQRGYIEIPLTVILSYKQRETVHRASRTLDLRVRVDNTRLRRRLDSKLDLLMGKTPREMQG